MLHAEQAKIIPRTDFHACPYDKRLKADCNPCPHVSAILNSSAGFKNGQKWASSYTEPGMRLPAGQKTVSFRPAGPNSGLARLSPSKGQAAARGCEPGIRQGKARTA